MLWNYDVSDKEEAERMASLYGEDFTRAVEPGMEVETGRNLVRRCGNELGVATWEAYDFDPDTWTCETFSNREAAELWLSGSLYLDECNELDDQLTQSVKRMATLAANMSGGRWTAGIQEYRDGRKSLSFQLSDETGFFLITSPICKASELALGVVRNRVREELADLDPYREALEACRRAENSSIALDKLAFYEKLKDRDMPVLLGALAVATEQNQRAIGRLLADRKFEDMPELPDAINPMEAAFAEAKGKLLEWKEGGHGDGMYYHDTASSYLDDYHDMADEIGRPLLEGIDEMINTATSTSPASTRTPSRQSAPCSPKPHLSMHAQTPSTSTRTSACAPRRASICGPSPGKSPRRSRRPSPPKRSPRRRADPSTRSPE